MLASGGGAADGFIRVWSVGACAVKTEVNTNMQVSACIDSVVLSSASPFFFISSSVSSYSFPSSSYSSSSSSSLLLLLLVVVVVVVVVVMLLLLLLLLLILLLLRPVTQTTVAGYGLPVLPNSFSQSLRHN